MSIKLGDRVVDRISGFKGIATARTEYLNGCISILIQSEDLDEGKKKKGIWFDDVQLDVKRKQAFKEPGKKSVGGPPRSTPSHN